MDMRRVVPGIRELGRRPVVEDLPAHEHEPLDEGLDGAELMGDVDDRHPELPVQLAEERCERFLGVSVHAGCGLVQHEEVGLAGERLGNRGALLLAAGETLDR
jgi:hypothetical protein